MARFKSDDNIIYSNSPTARKKMNKGNKYLAKCIVAIVLCVLMAVTGGGMIYFYDLVSSITYEPEDYNAPPSSDENNASGMTDMNLNDANSDLLNDSQILNIMLFGEDNADGQEFGRSDTMILLSIDNRHKKIKLASFQRDLKVEIPLEDGTTSVNKINHSYSLGGPSLTIKTIESNFGIDVDRYIKIDFASFIDIIDICGGLEIELTQEEIDYINWQLRKNNQASKVGEVVATPGIVKLNGQQALWHARNRGDDSAGFSGDDWKRTSRQRTILEEMMKSVKDSDLQELVQIVGKVGPMTTTNFKTDEITMLVSNALTYLSYDVEQTTVPADGFWRYEDIYNNNGALIQSYITIDDWNGAKYDLAYFIFESLVGSAPSTSSETEETTDDYMQ